jgi:hypothetical protein
METLSEAYHVRTDSQLSSFPFPTPSTFSSANQTVFIHARARVSVCPRDKKKERKKAFQIEINLCFAQSQSCYTIKHVEDCKHKDEDMELVDSFC